MVGVHNSDKVKQKASLRVEVTFLSSFNMLAPSQSAGSHHICSKEKSLLTSRLLERQEWCEAACLAREHIDIHPLRHHKCLYCFCERLPEFRHLHGRPKRIAVHQIDLQSRVSVLLGFWTCSSVWVLHECGPDSFEQLAEGLVGDEKLKGAAKSDGCPGL